jgi:hypothetical protein
MRGIGWSPIRDGSDWITGWSHPMYPPISAPAMAPEVLFGTLRSFGIEFAAQIAAALDGAAPNAAHYIAARVLRAGGCVWTPNVDRAVEAACGDLGVRPVRTGPAADRAPDLLHPLRDTHAGTLVKFHGTVEDPNTLAFTDRELLAPLDLGDVDVLTSVARGRHVVLYGYAGADADLADLLGEVFRQALSVTWFEPSRKLRSRYRGRFLMRRSGSSR